jgi:hypothetical protein
LEGLKPIFEAENNTDMQINDLKNLVNAGKYVELFEILDSYFVQNPDHQYATLKQNITFQLTNVGAVPNGQVQALLMFLNGEKVKKCLENLASQQVHQPASLPLSVSTLTTQNTAVNENTDI